MRGGILLQSLAVTGRSLAAQASIQDGSALLELQQATLAAQLSGWQASTDPCGGAPNCAVGSCAWQGVGCQNGSIASLSLANLGLKGNLPSNWTPPATLQSLDLSNNPGLCGVVPQALTSTIGMITTANTGLGVPCTSSSSRPGPLVPWAQAVIAIGAIGIALVVAALAVLMVRRRRSGAARIGGNLLAADHPDLVQPQDSVMVTKKRQHTPGAPLPTIQSLNLREGAEDNQEPCERPVRMVAFDAGTCGTEEEANDADMRKRLRSENVQDSVLIIRKQLTRHQQEDDSGEGEEGGGTEAVTSSNLAGTSQRQVRLVTP